MSSAEAKPQSAPARPIPFIDLQAQRARIADDVDAAIQRVLAHGQYILGPEVAELEQALAAFAGVRHAIACSNGTDALTLALRAFGIGPGDAVFVPAFTFTATAEVVALAGATPVFVDVLDSDFNIDPDSLSAAIADITETAQLRPRAIIAVDLFGQPADYHAVARIADDKGLRLIADAAQSFGASYHNRRTGSIGDIAATSFFPAKPLGCYGDGGATFTDDDGLAELMRSLRVHGQGVDKYNNDRVGLNARLDTIQAAVLLQKLKIFPDEIERRQRVAERYEAGLADLVQVPRLGAGRSSVWAQYTVLLPDRDRVRAALSSVGIPTAIYYPTPLNRQVAYQACPTAPGGVGTSERLAAQVLSLPMHPYLEPELQDQVIDAFRTAVSAADVP